MSADYSTATMWRSDEPVVADDATEGREISETSRRESLPSQQRTPVWVIPYGWTTANWEPWIDVGLAPMRPVRVVTLVEDHVAVVGSEGQESLREASSSWEPRISTGLALIRTVRAVRLGENYVAMVRSEGQEPQWEESSSQWTRQRSRIFEEVGTLLASASQETFEYGMESDFSIALADMIRMFGESVVDALGWFIKRNRVDGEVAWEALRWLGRIGDPRTYTARRTMLAEFVMSDKLDVRDGALLGIASLDDPGLIPALEEAIGAEKITALRRTMGDVLAQLEATRIAKISDTNSAETVV